MTEQPDSRLAHDIRAALVNHAGLQREVSQSLRQLAVLLETDAVELPEEFNGPLEREDALKMLAIATVFTEDIDTCLPMLEQSSERLAGVLGHWCDAAVKIDGAQTS